MSDLIMADISMVGDPSWSPLSGNMLWDRDFVKRPFSFESFISLHERMSVFSWKEYWECSISSYLSLQPLLFSQGFHIWQEIDEDFFIHQMCTALILWSIGLVLTFSSQSAPCEDTPCLVGDNLVTRNIKIINMNLRYEYKGSVKSRLKIYLIYKLRSMAGWLAREGRSNSSPVSWAVLRLFVRAALSLLIAVGSLWQKIYDQKTDFYVLGFNFTSNDWHDK